jgi:hypothetical protein
MSVTTGGISYTEKDISVAASGVDDFDLSPDNRQLAHTKTIDVAWADRYSLVNELYNTSQLCPVTGLYALNFHIEPFGKPSGENTWAKARIAIGYRNLSYDPSVNKEEIYESGLYTPDLSKSKADDTAAWEFSGTDATKAPTITFGQILYTVVKHNAGSFDRTTADGLCNKVNNATFNSWLTGHVLFEGYNCTQRTSVSGGTTYEIAYKFRWLQIPHNYEFNPATGTFAEITAKVGGAKKFLSGDFSTLSL